MSAPQIGLAVICVAVVFGLIAMAQDCFRTRDFGSGLIISVFAGMALFVAYASLATPR